MTCPGTYQKKSTKWLINIGNGAQLPGHKENASIATMNYYLRVTKLA